MLEDLKSIVDPNEKILYEGKPNKKSYIFESIFNPLLPFALLWAVFDFSFMKVSFFSNDSSRLYFLIPFMLIHLLPVWIYLGGILFSSIKYKNMAYIVTDKAIYVSSGLFTHNINSKPFAELSHIDLHRSIFDQIFHVGDVIATSSQLTQNGRSTTIAISNISNYIEVYNLVKKLQTDIYTDVMYPNDKRPPENHGYNTQYKG